MLLLIPMSVMGNEVPRLDTWHKDASLNLQKSGIKNRIAFIKKSKKGYRPIGFKSRGFVVPFSKRYLKFFQTRNGKFKSKSKKKYSDFLMTHFPLDAVVSVGRKKSSIVVLDSTGKFENIKISGLKKKQSITKWFFKEMGYDGVVLDRKNKFLLIQGFEKLKEKSQAISLTGSKDKFRVDSQSGSKANSLIQLVESKGSLGVFEILLVDDKTNEISAGTKVLFGKSKK